MAILIFSLGMVGRALGQKNLLVAQYQMGEELNKCMF